MTAATMLSVATLRPNAELAKDFPVFRALPELRPPVPVERGETIVTS
jgi:hypothetical protein